MMTFQLFLGVLIVANLYTVAVTERTDMRVIFASLAAAIAYGAGLLTEKRWL